MGLHVRLVDKKRFVGLPRDLDAETVSELRPAVASLVTGDARDMAFDMSRVRFIDSSGIGLLVFAYKRLAAAGRELTLFGLVGQPRQLIEFLRIDQIIRIEAPMERDRPEAAS